MAIEHVDIGAGEIHEPKGIFTANSNEVYVADGLGSGAWGKVAPTVGIERLIDSASTAATQLPAGLGSAMQIEFGPAVGTGANPVMLSAAGAITINESGLYRFKVSVQYGRAGATGASIIFLRALVNGVQAGRSIATKVDNADSLINFSDEAWLFLPATTVITYEIIRDSAGDNSGGLYQTTSSHGWNSSPTASLRVERWT